MPKVNSLKDIDLTISKSKGIKINLGIIYVDKAFIENAPDEEILKFLETMSKEVLTKVLKNYRDRKGRVG